VLWIAGELDLIAAGALAERARAAIAAVPGPVVIDLSGLKFVDVRGAHALDELVRTLPDGRTAAFRRCPLRVRRVLNLLGLAADALPARDRTAPQLAMPELAAQVRRARLEAAGSILDVSGTLARLASTRVRLASTIERAGLLREQGRQAVASSRAARQQLTPAGREPELSAGQPPSPSPGLPL